MNTASSRAFSCLHETPRRCPHPWPLTEKLSRRSLLALVVAWFIGSGIAAAAVPVVELSGSGQEIGKRHARELAEPIGELHER